MTHSKDYINNLKDSFPQKGLKFLDGDTVVSPESKKAVFDAAGSTIRAIDGIESNQFKNAFCLARPPGHHAEKNKAMGFCCISNAGVATNYLVTKYKYKRIACVDFDVHWGNGNYDVMRNNKNSLYISTHQYPFYPGTGSVNEKGTSNNILNITLDPGTSSDIYFNSFENVLKKLKSFNPEFILLSSGFDAHQKDPLAQVNLKSKDFYEITKRIMNVAGNICDGRIVSILEGGYDLDALKESAYEHVKALIEN